VLVGATSDQQSSTVYHDIATKRSDFFRVARSSRWTDPKKPTELVDDQPSAFHAYLHCLYFDEKVFLGRKTEAHAADNSNDNSSSSSQVGETMRFVLDLYILADKLLDPTTANIVMDKIIRHLEKKHWTLDHTTVVHVYASTQMAACCATLFATGTSKISRKTGWGVSQRRNGDFHTSSCRTS
jgi:hypothetical protein